MASWEIPVNINCTTHSIVPAAKLADTRSQGSSQYQYARYPIQLRVEASDPILYSPIQSKSGRIVKSLHRLISDTHIAMQSPVHTLIPNLTGFTQSHPVPDGLHPYSTSIKIATTTNVYKSLYASRQRGHNCYILLKVIHNITSAGPCTVNYQLASPLERPLSGPCSTVPNYRLVNRKLVHHLQFKSMPHTLLGYIYGYFPTRVPCCRRTQLI